MFELSEKFLKLLVTGAAGFIGFDTAKALLERGDDVVGLANLNDYYNVGLERARLDILRQASSFEFVKLVLADCDGMAAQFRRGEFQRVVHLGA